MFKETRLRSTLKTLSWRGLGTIVTTILVFIFTGKILFAVTIGGFEGILKMILYFFHERLWNKISVGKKQVAPFVLWFTGLPASGKSTFADAVYVCLLRNSLKVERLDGERIRAIFPEIGYSKFERDEHIKKAGYLASLLEKNGVIVVASFVSPYKETRDFVRKLCSHFIEIYVNTPLEECEKRDSKGLYKKARKGIIKNFTGIDDPYEAPKNSEIIIDGVNETVSNATQKIFNYLKQRKLLA